MWTFFQLKLADQALAIADLTAATNAINAQTIAMPTQSVSVAAIHATLMLSVSHDWLKVQNRAAQPFSAGWPGSALATDAAIGAAKLAVELAGSKVDVIEPPALPGFSAMLGYLVSAGDVDPTTRSLILAMANPSATMPAWVPAVTVGDLQTARAM